MIEIHFWGQFLPSKLFSAMPTSKSLSLPIGLYLVFELTSWRYITLRVFVYHLTRSQCDPARPSSGGTWFVNLEDLLGLKNFSRKREKLGKETGWKNRWGFLTNGFESDRLKLVVRIDRLNTLINWWWCDQRISNPDLSHWRAYFLVLSGLDDLSMSRVVLEWSIIIIVTPGGPC